MEATILKWHKKPGDNIAMDETVLDIATDKVDSEVPSTAAGVIESILFNENDVVPIGTVIAKIRVNASAGNAPTTAPAKPAVTTTIVEDIPYQPAPAPITSSAAGPRFYSPLVLSIAQSEGISMTELEQIPGTGQDGRVSKKDILAYVAQRKNTDNVPQVVAAPIISAPATAPAQTSAPVTYQGNVEIIEMDRMRKLIAKHMVDSKHTSPHVTSFAECDVTNMVQWQIGRAHV